MKKSYLILVLFLVSAAARGDVRVALEIMPPQVLAATPAQFDVIIYNNAEEAVDVPNRFQFHVTDVTGQTFTILSYSGADEHAPTDVLGSGPIPGRSSRRAAFRPGHDGTDGTIFADPRLSVPGGYDIKAALVPSGVSSPAVRLTVLEPSGVDREAYSYMLELAGGAWSGEQRVALQWKLAEDLPLKFPSSEYVGYVLTSSGRSASEIAAAVDAYLRKHPRHPNTDELFLFVARSWNESANFQLSSKRNLKSALTAASQARRVTDQIIDQVKNVAIRQAAIELKSKLVTDDELRAAFTPARN
jgi:hypothetical protein